MELMGFCQKNQPICPGQNSQITAKNSVPLAGLVQKTTGFQLFSLPFLLQDSRNLDWYLLINLLLHLKPDITAIQWLQL